MKTFKELLEMQKDLDVAISGNDVYKSDILCDNVRLALLVEIGELANEIASFKHWKKSHVINKERVLDEEADVMHFILSLINFANSEGELEEVVNTFDIEKLKDPTEKQEMNNLFIALYGETMGGNIGGAFHALILINRIGGFTEKELVEAYIKKNNVNFERIAGGY